MTDKIVNSSIEILGKFYSIRCSESELKELQQAAVFLNKKMLEVQESGKAINLERIAIITALNVSFQFLQLSQQQNHVADHINQRIVQLQRLLEQADHSISHVASVGAELIYSAK